MPFLSVSPYNFRNLQNETADISAREVFFTGENGQGKSNLLEALYYSSYGSSFRTRAESEIIRHGQSVMGIRAMYREQNGTTHTTAISVEKSAKKIERDGKMLRDRKELVNTMPCVLYSHDDLDFAVGEPERRRFFVDQSLSMYDVMYIDVMRRYKRVLRNRNVCLKEQRYDLLDSYDVQLAMNGLEIQKKRKGAVFQFNQLFGDLYARVTGIEGVRIQYVPSWKSVPRDEGNATAFEDKDIPGMEDTLLFLRGRHEADKATGTTLTGPHRDRITFLRGGEPFVPTASTGQRRLVALLLRTAQAAYYTQVTGKKPVLLMDDVMLELDPEKRELFTASLPEYDQLFCTFLPGEPYQKYCRSGTMVYRVQDGSWKAAE